MIRRIIFSMPYFAFWVQSWLKDLVSLLVFPGSIFQRVLSARSGVRVLLYHAVQEISPEQDPMRLSVSPALLRAHLKCLRKLGFVIVPLAAVLEHVKGKRVLSPRSVALTFDDGYADHFAVVHPLLQEFDAPATFFVICQAIETGQTVDGLKGELSLRRSMNLDQVRYLCKAGMEIGSHSMTHTSLAELDDSQVAHETCASKAYLEGYLEKTVKMFAYPFGAYGTFNEKTRKALQSAGYEGACVNLLGWNRPGDDPFALRRTRIGWNDRGWRFVLKVRGGYDWFDGYWIRQISSHLTSTVHAEGIP